MYNWIPIYKEIADKVFGYEHKHADLFTIIDDLHKKDLPIIPMSDKDGKGEITLAEIDPFTFFANFNRGITDKNRTHIIEYLKAFWNLDAEKAQSEKILSL